MLHHFKDNKNRTNFNKIEFKNTKVLMSVYYFLYKIFIKLISLL